jgi:hypothetical protein
VQAHAAPCPDEAAERRMLALGAARVGADLERHPGEDRGGAERNGRGAA